MDSRRPRSPTLLQKLAQKLSPGRSRSRVASTSTSVNNAASTIAAQQARNAALRECGLLPPLPSGVPEAHKDGRTRERTTRDRTTVASRIKQQWEAKNHAGLVILDQLEEADALVEEQEEGAERDSASFICDTPSLLSNNSDSGSAMTLSAQSFVGGGGNVSVWNASDDPPAFKATLEKGFGEKTGSSGRDGERSHKTVAGRYSSFTQHALRVGVNPTMHTPGSIMAQASQIEDAESRRLTEVAFM
ncbi:hypothetical protein MIND_00279200 [Mycena indigotica]|uniref:Uncharacterized protein n=1 Tax=Mycena indigotica TaxID=2126181 RepID=A0A8H6T842_9AGAR|nr:uncharacterized protein MIND_00279200 [Mycena indigotica]KAF7312651.1 hypothetical protein MIND_00279200 [Mycena indigotica]